MTAFLDQTAAVISRLEANFATLPVVIDNDDASDKDLTSGYVYCEVVWQDARQASINGPNPLFRHTGVVNIEINTPVNQGQGTGLTYAATIAAIFRGQSFSDLLFFAPSIVVAQRQSNQYGEFWMTPVICGFQYDEHFSIM